MEGSDGCMRAHPARACTTVSLPGAWWVTALGALRRSSVPSSPPNARRAPQRHWRSRWLTYDSACTGTLLCASPRTHQYLERGSSSKSKGQPLVEQSRSDTDWHNIDWYEQNKFKLPEILSCNKISITVSIIFSTLRYVTMWEYFMWKHFTGYTAQHTRQLEYSFHTVIGRAKGKEKYFKCDFEHTNFRASVKQWTSHFHKLTLHLFRSRKKKKKAVPSANG